MRTKAKEKIYTTRLEGDWFTAFNGYTVPPRMCSDTVREAFEIRRARRVDFRVTNSKPKRLSGWHILRQESPSHWVVTTGTSYMGLMSVPSEVLSDDFPNNKTLYVCAY